MMVPVKLILVFPFTIQEQVRSGDASATEYFELGAVMLRRKFYPAAIKYLQQAIEKWDGDDQDLSQVHKGPTWRCCYNFTGLLLQSCKPIRD